MKKATLKSLFSFDIVTKIQSVKNKNFVNVIDES